jgi:Asp-tRNA(Asn)/Glu-tRNA(Gln) amidotransferase C subunit
MNDLWKIIDQHWNLFQPILGKNKGYWKLRLELLSTVRSPMAYQRSNTVFTEYELEEVKEHCEDILNLLSKSFDSTNLDSEMSKSGIVFNVNNQVQAMGQSESKSESKGDTYKQSGNFGIGHMSGGNIQEGAKVAAKINEAEQQNLAKAAQEIQQLLEQLSQTYPTQTFPQKAAVAVEAVKEIENNPTLKERIRNAIKAMGVQAFMEAIDHPVANILREGIEAFKEPSDD